MSPETPLTAREFDRGLDLLGQRFDRSIEMLSERHSNDVAGVHARLGRFETEMRESSVSHAERITAVETRQEDAASEASRKGTRSGILSGASASALIGALSQLVQWLGWK